jgi:hypothetical protein
MATTQEQQDQEAIARWEDEGGAINPSEEN